MDSINVYNKITLKAVFTRQLKEKMTAELKSLLTEIDMELQQLEFQSKRILAGAEKANPQQRLGLKQEIDQKKEEAESKREKIKKQLQDVNQYTPGDEVFQGTLSGVVTLKVGDNLDDCLVQEVLVKDGIIVEIR